MSDRIFRFFLGHTMESDVVDVPIDPAEFESHLNKYILNCKLENLANYHSRHPFNDDRIVLPAEAVFVAHDHIDLRFPRFVRYVIKVAIGIEVFQVHRGWKNLIAQGEDAADGFYRAGGCYQVAEHALDAADRNGAGVFAEDLFDSAGFVAIILRVPVPWALM